MTKALFFRVAIETLSSSHAAFVFLSFVACRTCGSQTNECFIRCAFSRGMRHMSAALATSFLCFELYLEFAA